MIRTYFRGVVKETNDYDFKKFDREFFITFLNYIVDTQILLTNVINNTENLESVSEKSNLFHQKIDTMDV